ncbi:aminodeoxychorismate/anthranilate synthase component II [Streptomyces sp. JJ66]|uniref:aminodeoxychorismate/anthranilate synthase component II n=1 Tax=Streptomyces sp. JJ66 TaxID=2803843 RepID=UPI001C58AC7A|nr:aminodeoxychorismate/anthranilate synthase component II [Streptomyces sp. JJ66]
MTVRRYDAPGLRRVVRAHPGPVVLGPGPGDPRDAHDPRLRGLRALTAELLRGHRHGLLGVCLGNELLAAELGLPLVRKDQPFQGAQERIDLFGEAHTVGFYNSFTARCDAATADRLARSGVDLARDPASGDVHALRAPGAAGVQFHPESVLTLEGTRVLANLLAAIQTPGDRAR